MHGSLEVEMCGQRRQVIGIMIHVMAATGLGGAAMATPVVGYDAIAAVEEEQHLCVPIIGRQRPAVAENNGLTFAPVFVIDLRSVFSRDRVHIFFLFLALIGLVSSPIPVVNTMRDFERNKAA